MRKIILAGVCLQANSSSFASAMQECEALCNACDLEVSGTITQQSKSMDPHTAFRRGKLETLKAMCEELGADGIIFYNPLKIQVSDRISAYCGVNVIDRTALILDIFSKRARSRQAKLQTEVARLQYDLPRVLHADNDNERSRGGAVTNRGAGEMRSSIIATRYQKKISDLKEELRKIEVRRYQDERRRQKTLLKRVALVGYTNAGKSSLMNAILSMQDAGGQEVLEQDMLFATLDTSVRMVQSKHKKFLLYDTVGFVSDLPHGLIEAFKSTLDAARDADLLVHVIDAADPSWQEKSAITQETLKEIHAADIPQIHVFNKIDKLAHPERVDGLSISCYTKEGLDTLLEEIIEMIYPAEESIVCKLGYDKISMFDTYKAILDMDILEYHQNGLIARITGEKKMLHVFAKYQIKGE